MNAPKANSQSEEHSPVTFSFSFPHRAMDRDAFGLVRQLKRAGYLAYFVGGCVRDVLLGKVPKDFDIVTSARPREVRRVFRNAQLIGRRFKLAHVYFRGGKYLEVATFRMSPSGDSVEDGVILEDNEYGTPATDAFRRDFTLNALFYDPVDKEIIDFTGGLDDIDTRLIRSIGDPAVRFREDPIRMLRAIKFAARLGLSFDEAVSNAMVSECRSLTKAARPRLQQELMRFLQGGSATRSFELLSDYHFLPLLFPELDALMVERSEVRNRFNALLEAHDALIEELGDDGWTSAGREELILSVLLWTLVDHLLPLPPQLSAGEQNPDEVRRPHARSMRLLLLRLLAPFATRVGVSIKSLHGLSRLLVTQRLLDWRWKELAVTASRTKESSIFSKTGAQMWPTLILLKTRFRAGQISHEMWSAAESRWNSELGSKKKTDNHTFERRTLVPNKPVVKPTTRRRRRK